jgi:glycosyltransferase involved in cell wall biosynthesis
VRVLIDTTYARRAPFSGTAVYLDRLADALAAAGAGAVEVVTVANRHRRPPAGGGIGSLRNALSDRWWTGRELPRLARREHADVIHHPLPAYAPRARVPQVVTVMDLAYERLPECFDRRFRTYAHAAYRMAALAAAAVICPSETTAADARELWGLDSGRIVVAPLGPGQALPTAPGDRAGTAAERDHFLYVGDAEPRKDLGTLIEGYRIYRAGERSPLPLVLAGSAAASGPGIQVRNRPSAEQLDALYATAVALVHPSLYEGFGLTALEAMSAGVPVIAAAAPGVSEVCGDAACYAEPRSPGSFAQAMARVAQDPALRAELCERGRRRAQRFSWDGCARAHISAYSLAAEHA